MISISDPIIISPLQMALTQMVEKNEALYNSAKKYRTVCFSAIYLLSPLEEIVFFAFIADSLQ